MDHGEIVGYKEMEMAWVGNMSPDKLRKYIEEWTRLRNAVYVTYPYARVAGSTINDINAKMVNVSSKKERKSTPSPLRSILWKRGVERSLEERWSEIRCLNLNGSFVLV